MAMNHVSAGQRVDHDGLSNNGTNRIGCGHRVDTDGHNADSHEPCQSRPLVWPGTVSK